MGTVNIQLCVMKFLTVCCRKIKTRTQYFFSFEMCSFCPIAFGVFNLCVFTNRTDVNEKT